MAADQEISHQEVCADNIDEMEQYARRNNLRVYSIPEMAGEDTDRQIVRATVTRQNGRGPG